MNKLETKSCEEIMMTVYKPIEFVVDGLKDCISSQELQRSENRGCRLISV